MSFYIKYEWINVDNGMDIADFWESLIWFSELSKEIFKVWKIKTDVDVRVTSVRKWSIIADIAISLQDYIHSFWSFEDFLYFLEITNTELFNEITSKLQEIWSDWVQKWKDLESFNKDYPTVWSIIANGIYDLLKTYLFVVIYFKIKSRNIDKIRDDENVNIWNWQQVKWETLKLIKKIVNKWKSSHFLEPIIEDKVSSIKIWKGDGFIEINHQNFEDFIWEWNEVLPELKNWEKYEFIWSFTAMQSNRGETITFLSHHFKTSNNKNFQFSCYLVDWKTTENYSDYYGSSKSLKVLAEVIRISDYKKPKLKILDVEVYQTILDI